MSRGRLLTVKTVHPASVRLHLPGSLFKIGRHALEDYQCTTGKYSKSSRMMCLVCLQEELGFSAEQKEHLLGAYNTHLQNVSLIWDKRRLLHDQLQVSKALHSSSTSSFCFIQLRYSRLTSRDSSLCCLWKLVAAAWPFCRHIDAMGLDGVQALQAKDFRS